MMKYATLGNTGLLVSKLCFGTMTFGDGRGMFKAIGAVGQAVHHQLLRLFARVLPLVQHPELEVHVFERALKRWTGLWERNHESSMDPQSPHGPLTFTSTSLLRLAYIRLNLDLGASTKIAKWLTWNVTLSDRYNAKPALGRKTNDFLYSTGIGVTFAR